MYNAAVPNNLLCRKLCSARKKYAHSWFLLTDRDTNLEMNTPTANDIARRVVDACTQGSSGQIYVIGSFGHFLNFSAQQFRALNLAWALEYLGAIPPSHPIAVIGGGLTGITVATALVRLGYSIDLYEAQNELMAHQLATDHRLVHPSINRWPKAPLTPATMFPFLNWVSGPCSKVVSGLLHEVEELQRSAPDRFSISRGRKITDIDRGLNGYLLGISGKTINKPYGSVIIAVGVGEERANDKFEVTSYWYPDGVEHATFVGSTHYFLVSGCGDGGLIDALRIVHRDFEKGGLIFRTADALDGSELARRIASVETGQRISPLLEQVYVAAAQEIASDPQYKEIHNELARSASPARPLVRLSARHGENAFVGRAAPIHKLMVAHAMLLNRIAYNRSEIDVVGKNIVVAEKAFPLGKTTRVIIRHGPVGAPLTGLVSDAQVSDLREKQQAIEELLTNAAWKGDYPSRSQESDQQRIERLYRQAVRAIRLIQPLATVSISNSGYDVVLPADTSERKIPREIFGIPVRIQREPQKLP